MSETNHPVNDNAITGSAPFEWFGMSSESPLLRINMARNMLSGLPNSGISNLGALEELYLSYNGLIGSLPHMSNLTNLRKYLFVCVVLRPDYW